MMSQILLITFQQNMNDKSNYDKKWLLTAVLMKNDFFEQKMPKFSKIRN